jgi:uncharacterized membrane protein YhaH (DUF805 family)
MSEEQPKTTLNYPKPKTDRLGGWLNGRGGRREYWLWVAPLMIAAFVVGALGLTNPLLSLLLGLPILFQYIRRLHDLGHSGWWAPVINIGVTVLGFAAKSFLPVDAAIVAALLYLVPLIALGVLAGQSTANRYGPPISGTRRAKVEEVFD